MEQAYRDIDRQVISATDVRMSFSPANAPAVSFTTASRHGTQPQEAGAAYAIFRNADKDIVGGTGASRADDRTTGVTIDPQWNLAAEAPVPELATVEVYAFG
jgi:hypothetical protein